jgi:hypothetical protein
MIWLALQGGFEVMTYRGIVKGKVIELEDNVILPEGTEVEVLIKEERVAEAAPSEYPKGSPKALLFALNLPPRCTSEDVEALVHAIQQGKQPVRFEGIFE